MLHGPTGIEVKRSKGAQLAGVGTGSMHVQHVLSGGPTHAAVAVADNACLLVSTAVMIVFCVCRVCPHAWAAHQFYGLCLYDYIYMPASHELSRRRSETRQRQMQQLHLN